MNIQNATPYQSGWTMGFERDGRELLAVMVKATFQIPEKPGEPPPLAPEQAKLTEADVSSGEPGFSAIVYESDYAHRKPFCDILLNGSAYVPNGGTAREIGVGLRVGSLEKVFKVVGDRHWGVGILTVSASPPKPFSVMPISYDCAFGGFDNSNPELLRVYNQNPAGKGFSYHMKKLDGSPLPNTEKLGQSVERPGGSYHPMAFGPIGRAWEPRCKFAGTYTKQWIETRAPFWPDDFDYRHFQASPPDQQMPYLQGGEEVALANLSPRGTIRFCLPVIPMPAIFIPHQGNDHHVQAVIDTLMLEPDLNRFSITWRATMSMRRSLFDIKEIIIGQMPQSWLRSRRFPGKTWYRNLDELVKARSKRGNA